VEELRSSLNLAEFRASEATEALRSLREKESSLQSRLDKLNAELDGCKMEARRTQTQLREERDDLKAQVGTYSSRCQVLCCIRTFKFYVLSIKSTRLRSLGFQPLKIPSDASVAGLVEC
jgi:DNA repair exonuclease SbcCD ATPase subunit